MTVQEFKALSNVARSDYLRNNFPVNAKSRAFRRPAHGLGINDADYITNPAIDGKRVRCPAYATWAHMLDRAYCPKYQSNKPTYAGVTVFKEWLSFSAFRSWWITHQVDGWELDKDLLGDSREYGPESCIFVPQWLNKFTIDRAASRGNCPIGACWRKVAGKYQAYCNHPFGKLEYLGYFTNADDAHAAWLARKLEIAAELKKHIDEIDVRIYPRVVEIIQSAK